MREGSIKEYLSKWAYEKFYSDLKLGGNLTNRIKSISGGICYRNIVETIFDRKDPLEKVTSSIVLTDDYCKSIIRNMHKENSSLTGIFMDYLIRRIISELTQEDFSDHRAMALTKEVEFLDEDVKLWMFYYPDEPDFDEVYEAGGWNVSESPSLDSKVINEIECDEKFIELERKDEWMKIEFKGKIGWVRHSIPPPGKDAGKITNKRLFVQNRWFMKPSDRHYCKGGCKTGMLDCWKGTWLDFDIAKIFARIKLTILKNLRPWMWYEKFS